MQKGRTGRFTMQNGELIKSTLVVIFWFNEELLPRMVHGIRKNGIPRTSRTIAKVTNILKVRATLSTRGK